MMPPIFFWTEVCLRIGDLIIALVLICTAVTDINRREVPIMYQVLLLVLIPFGFHIENLWGVLIAVPFFIASALTDKIGGGDWKLVALLGVLLGINRAFVTVVMGCIIFIISGLIMDKKKGKDDMLFPFVPSLTAGYIVRLILEAIF